LKQSRGLTSSDRQRTAPDSTALNNCDRVLEVEPLGSTQDPAKQRSMSASEYDPPRKRMIPGPAAFAAAIKRG
jgi:hypothetical protein